MNVAMLAGLTDELQKIAAEPVPEHPDDRMKRYIGAAVAPTGVQMAAAGLGASVMPMMGMGKGGNKEQAIARMREMASQMGVDPKGVDFSAEDFIPAQMQPRGSAKRLRAGGPMGLPQVQTSPNHAVQVPARAHESMIAHELGHVKNHEMAQRLGKKVGLPNIGRASLYSGGPIGQTSSAITSMIAAGQKDPSYKPGLVNAGVWAPRIADEAGASLRAGAHFIRQHGVGKGLMKSMPLVPAFGTYATMAGAPLAITAVRKHLAKKKAKQMAKTSARMSSTRPQMEDVMPGGPLPGLSRKVVGRDPGTFETQGPEKKVIASHKCMYCKNPAVKGYRWAEGHAIIPVCENHEKKAQHQIEVTNKDEVCGVKKYSSIRGMRPAPKRFLFRSQMDETTAPPTSVMQPNG